MTARVSKIAPCDPSCSTYRVEIDRSPNVADWTKCELVAEVRKLKCDLAKTEDRVLAYDRQTRIAKKKLAAVPAWVRWLFGGRR